MFALPIFTASHPATIVGANELNFCVRDGNRWTLIAINTNSYGWAFAHLLFRCPFADFCYSPHCSVWIVSNLFQFVNPFLRRNLVTHTGFEPMLTAWEAAVLTTWPMGHLVHLHGLEPGTHWLRVSCSTNWAKGAFPYALSLFDSVHGAIHPENWTLFLISNP